jgi:hypothetical protein
MEAGRAMGNNENREGEILCVVLVRKQVPAVGRSC